METKKKTNGHIPKVGTTKKRSYDELVIYSEIEKLNLLVLKNVTFVNLKGKVLAEYNIVYHINDCFSIRKLEKFKMKHQLLFQKLVNKVQQVNLVLIDSIFPSTLADLALEVFINKITKFNQYIELWKGQHLIELYSDKEYLKYKFFKFVHHLLYSQISSSKVCKGEIEQNLIFCLKNQTGQLDFYSIYEQNELQLMLLESMKLEIDLKKSVIHKNKVKIRFKIFVE